MSQRSPGYFVDLVHHLRHHRREEEWLEFKAGNQDPEAIGKYISALANAATLAGRARAYMLWGIDDDSHEVIGTSFSPATVKRGNETLEAWLTQMLSQSASFEFHEVGIDCQTVIILEVHSASWTPVSFRRVEYVRVGSTNRPLQNHPEKARALWEVLNQSHFEEGVAAERMNGQEVLSDLDYSSYFQLLGIPLPDGHAAILDALERDRLINRSDAGRFDITNLGASLFATSLDSFPRLRRKAVRVIQYAGTDRTKTLREHESRKGYACGFEGLVNYINDRLPASETIEQALRETVPAFPHEAIRELVANAVIHQDFLMTGVGPTVEIFDDRVEITNPGRPLVATERFLDTPPRSRNEMLAAFLRRVGICEERGSGIDKVVSIIESFQLPAPLFETPPDATRTVLFAPRPLAAMAKSDRIRACYLHACLRHVANKPMTNASLRERFGIEAKNASIASRLLGEAIDAGRIVIADTEAGTRSRRYLPFWATTDSSESP